MDGIINVYKEPGFTSHDVVAKLRGILHQKKIGHTGTLDPAAAGVLPVCLGKATKVCDLLTDWKKEYRAVLLLGRTTDTQDTTGATLRECPVFLREAGVSEHSDGDCRVPAGAVVLTEEKIRSCIAAFAGEQQQIPPMYSALKVNGKKLYELARQGLEVERRPRTVSIENIRMERMELPEIELTVRCSKGTYIRTLCNDIGEKLGCGGCMASLLRTEVGPFQAANAQRLSEIEALCAEGRLDECVFPADFVFSDLEAVLLTPEAERLVRNGNPLSPGMIKDCRTAAEIQPDVLRIPLLPEQTVSGRQLRLYGQDGTFLAVYGYREEKHSWRAVKMFLS